MIRMKLQAGMQWGEVPLPLRFTPFLSLPHRQPLGQATPTLQGRVLFLCQNRRDQTKQRAAPRTPSSLQTFLSPTETHSALGRNTPLGSQAGGSGWVSPRPSQALPGSVDPAGHLLLRGLQAGCQPLKKLKWLYSKRGARRKRSFHLSLQGLSSQAS